MMQWPLAHRNWWGEHCCGANVAAQHRVKQLLDNFPKILHNTITSRWNTIQTFNKLHLNIHLQHLSGQKAKCYWTSSLHQKNNNQANDNNDNDDDSNQNHELPNQPEYKVFFLKYRFLEKGACLIFGSLRTDMKTMIMRSNLQN
jgi:hypothetical protein